MKTVTIRVEDQTWEAMQRLAQEQAQALDQLVSNMVNNYARSQSQAIPLPEQRRLVLDQLWNRIDACNVEVGERPNRSRTYDHRRFHRY